MTPLTPASVHAVRIEGACAVADLVLYSTRLCILTTLHSLAGKRDHKSAALALATGTTSQLPDGRPRDGEGDGDERGGARYAAGALASRPQPPPHVPTPRFPGSPGAMPWPAAQQPVSPRARRRSLDQPADLRVQADGGSAGGGGRRRRRSAMSCWPAPRRVTALGWCLGH